MFYSKMYLNLLEKFIFQDYHDDGNFGRHVLTK